jgi:hypothetical protein
MFRAATFEKDAAAFAVTRNFPARAALINRRARAKHGLQSARFRRSKLTSGETQ